MKKILPYTGWPAMALALAVLLSCAPAYDKGIIIVTYGPEVSAAQKDSILVRLHLERVETIGTSDVVRFPAGAHQGRIIERLEATPGIESVERDEPGKVESIDSGVVVAVIDSGIDYTHPDLAGHIYENSREIAGNALDDDQNGYKDDIRGWDFASGFAGDADASDTPKGSAMGHGTHVSGIILSPTPDSVGITILPLKVFSDYSSGGTVTQVSKAIYYAVGTPGVRVINISMLLAGYSATVERAMEAARLKGILVVCATGNAGANLDSAPTYPACYRSENILAVGATEPDKNWARYANYSATQADVAANGRNILSTKLGGGYENRTGTSQAAPRVARAAALIYVRKAAAGQLTGTAQDALDVKAEVLQSAEKLPALAGKSVSWGIMP
jgi:subtilisin family serine protease